MEIDITKNNEDDNLVLKSEIGDVIVAFDSKKDVISKIGFVVTKDRETGEIDIEFSCRNNMKIWTKEDKRPKELERLLEEMAKVFGIEPINIPDDYLKK